MISFGYCFFGCLLGWLFVVYWFRFCALMFDVGCNGDFGCFCFAWLFGFCCDELCFWFAIHLCWLLIFECFRDVGFNSI